MTDPAEIDRLEALELVLELQAPGFNAHWVRIRCDIGFRPSHRSCS